MLKGAWRVGLAVLLIAGSLGLAPRAAGAGNWSGGGGVQSDGSGGGQVVAFSFEVTTTSASGGSDGGTTTSSSSSGGADVQPTCWYEPKKTGREMVAEMRADGLAWKGLFLPDEEAASAHADDNGGRWYQTNCDTSTEEGRERMAKMMASSLRWVWVPEGRAAPEPVVDPVTLARAAVEAAAIPAPGVETNPRITTDDGVEGAAVVGVDTWVWAASDTPAGCSPPGAKGRPNWSSPPPSSRCSPPGVRGPGAHCLRRSQSESG